MFVCKKCSHCFRDSYNLTKHISRKKPCTPLQNENKNGNMFSSDKITSSSEKITSSSEKITSSSDKITSSLEDRKCEFCLNQFYCKKYKNKHEEICKFREDPIRLLEIEKEVKPKTTSNKILKKNIINNNIKKITISKKQHQ